MSGAVFSGTRSISHLEKYMFYIDEDWDNKCFKRNFKEPFCWNWSAIFLKWLGESFSTLVLVNISSGQQVKESDHHSGYDEDYTSQTGSVIDLHQCCVTFKCMSGIMGKGEGGTGCLKVLRKRREKKRKNEIFSCISISSLTRKHSASWHNFSTKKS